MHASSTLDSRKRLLISGYDSFYGSGSKIIDFSQNGACHLVHASVARSLAYVQDQYQDLANNVVHYFSATSFDKFSSVANYFKKNQHTYYISGLEVALILKRITSEPILHVTVYNSIEDKHKDLDFVKELVATGKARGIVVKVVGNPEPYITGLVVPTLVIEDESPAQTS